MIFVSHSLLDHNLSLNSIIDIRFSIFLIRLFFMYSQHNGMKVDELICVVDYFFSQQLLKYSILHNCVITIIPLQIDYTHATSTLRTVGIHWNI